MRPKSLLPCLKMELSDPVFLVPLDGTLPVAGTGAVPWCVCVAPAGTGAGWSAEFGGRPAPAAYIRSVFTSVKESITQPDSIPN